MINLLLLSLNALGTKKKNWRLIFQFTQNHVQFSVMQPKALTLDPFQITYLLTTDHYTQY